MLQRPRSSILFPQWFMGVGVGLLLMQTGFVGGWSSPTLARLTSPDSPMFVTNDEASWIASLVNFGRIFGAVVGPVSANFFGSKRAILLSLVFGALGWLLTIFASTVVWFYVARMFAGLGIGAVFGIYSLYIGEVSIPEIRGALVTLATTGYPVGQILASAFGSYLSIGISAGVYLACCILLIVLFYFLPESPHHLVKMDRIDEASRSIDWYRAGHGVSAELETVKKFVSSNKADSFVKKLKTFGTPVVRYALLQVLVLYTLKQLTGQSNVASYMETILVHARFTAFSPSDAVIYINVLGTAASVVAIFTIDRYGRRFLIILSSAGISISMFGLTSHFLLINNDWDAAELQWLPITSLFMFTLSFYMGYQSVPGTVLGEIFPANVKCTASCICNLNAALVAFVSTKTYQTMVDEVGESYVFLLHALIALIALPYVLLLMPETKGKSLLQIQEELLNRR